MRKEKERAAHRRGREAGTREREETAGFQLEGRNPVREALRAGRPIERILVAAAEGGPGPLGAIIAMARERGIRVDELPRSVLDKKSQTGGRHQGIIALTAAKAYAEVEDILAQAAASGEAPLLVLCDDWHDPHNLGALLRTVEGVGAHGVIIPARRSVGLTGIVAKTSAGAVEFVPVAKVNNLVQTMHKLKEAGLWLTGADLSGDKLPWEVDLTGPTAIVIGAEGEGLGRLTAESCDHLVRIPMAGRINSLNASVAGGMLLYEALRQRRLKSSAGSPTVQDKR